MVQSFRWPPGVVLKVTAFWPSPKVSSSTLRKSPRGVVVPDHRAGAEAARVDLPGIHHDVDRFVVVADAGVGAFGGSGAVGGQVDRHGQRGDGLPGRVVAPAVHLDLSLEPGERPDRVP